jgi:hypothetical protein
MDKVQKQLLDTYYRKRGIAVAQNARYNNKYQPYEYSKYALDNKIINLKVLTIGEQFEIYNTNKNVSNYILPYIEAYNKKSVGFLRILLNYIHSNNPTELEKFINNSEYIKNHETNLDISTTEIIITVDKQDILDATDLDYSYETIVSMASSYYYSERYADQDELNYMQRSLSTTNMEKIKKIAKVMGVKDDVIKKFNDDEGTLTKFLEEYKLENINETYLSEYGEAYGEAEARAALEQLKTFPMEIQNDETTININKLFSFIYTNNLNSVKTFDEFLENVGSRSDINLDSINEETYNGLDLTNLNNNIERELDDVMDGFDDPDSEYYNTVRGYRELQEYIQKFRFKIINKKGIIATHVQKDKTINIIDYGYDAGSDELKLNINLIYKAGQKRSGWIFAKNLGNYISQYELKGMKENR